LRIKRLLSAAAGVILLGIVGLPTALWIGFPVLAPVLAAPLLHARGIELIRLETTRPGLHGITMPTLELAQAANGVNLRGDDIHITWHITWERPLSGLRNGFTSVIIDRLAIAIDPPAAAPGTQPALPSGMVMPAALLAGLPTRSLEIATLTASGRIAEQPFEGEGRLRASPTDAFFSGVIQADALPASVAIRAQVHPGNVVSVRVDTAAAGGAFLTMDGTLSPTTNGPAFAGTAQLDLDRIQSWLAAPDPWPTGMLDLHLDITPDPTPTLTLQPTSKGRLQFRHGDMDAKVALALTEPLGLTFGDGAFAFTTGTLPLRIEARRDTLTMGGGFELAGVDFDTDRGAVASLSGTGRVSWPQGSGAFDLDLPLQAMTAPLQLQVGTGAELVLQPLAYRDATLARVKVRNQAPVEVSAEGLLEVAELSMVVDDPARMELTASLRIGPAGDVTAHLDEASLPLSANDLLAMVLPATVAPRSGRLHAQGRVHRSATGVMDADLKTRWQNAGIDLTSARIRGGSGAASFTYADAVLHVQSATAGIESFEWISADGPQATILLQDLQGAGSGTLAVGIGAGFGSGLDLGAVDMSAEFTSRRMARGELTAQGLGLDARLSGDVRRPHIEGRLRLTSAALGVPLQDGVCGFDTPDLEVWQLTDCSAAVLGGEVHLPRGDFDLATGSGYLPLAVTGLQLSAVLGLMQDPALDGTGILDGSLPLRLTAMQPALEQGWLAARPPGGVLSYVAAANVLASIEQPALRLTMRAIRDLRYQRLETRVDYKDDGTLALAVNLLGSNPEIEGGRPIQLNLNVTQNLLQLLQSLRLSGNIEQQLQRRLQRVQP